MAWLAGFAPVTTESAGKDDGAIGLVLAAPGGGQVVVDISVTALGHTGSLQRLEEQVAVISGRLTERQLSVPVIGCLVTNLARAELQSTLVAAAQLGLIVVYRELLLRGIVHTRAPVDADVVFANVASAASSGMVDALGHFVEAMPSPE